MHQPDRDTFRRLAREGNLVPVFRQIVADQDTPVSAYQRLRTALRRHDPGSHTFLFESVEGGESIARYSFLGGNPAEVIEATGRTVRLTRAGGAVETHTDTDPLAFVQSRMARFRPVPDARLPRFTGGMVGFAGYDAVAQFDRVPLSPKPGLGWPDMVFMLVDTVVIFDHVRHTVMLVTNALVDGDVDAAYDAAVARLDLLATRLDTPVPRRALDAGAAATATAEELHSNTTHAEYLDAVERSKEYIRAGDIIQVVLSQRFEAPAPSDPLDVYRALRLINPSPYLFCLELGGRTLVGSSPEVNVRCEDGEVNIRPIAGTRPRAADAAADRALGEELLADPKERAEHVMLVDLARNDIGRVCEWGSVTVSEFMVVERYSHVMHIVSNVRGRLRADRTAYDLLRATFPAGTLSGAPKIRAMEIIAELEASRRGAYGGAVGYFGFDGNHDSCIAIRTVLIHEGRAYVQAGAGIVADSVPQSEFDETCNKARGMLKALAVARQFSAHPASAPEVRT